jgi:D-alanine-D-alanine ligase
LTARRGSEHPGIEVVHTLEAHGVPFTGASSGFYEPSREAMKAACRAQRIATPRYVFAENDAEVDRAASELAFPLIVKHHSSYASVDLSRRSRVRTLAGLKQQARKIIRRHGRALIEEFIEGAECTVLVAENPDDPARPRTYVPLRYRFPDGETFKQRARQVDRLRPDVCRARRRSGIGRAASRRRRALFHRAQGHELRPLRHPRRSGRYAVHAGDQPELRRVLPASDPGSADLCLAHDAEGHAGFTRQLIRAALARHRRRATAPRPCRRRRRSTRVPDDLHRGGWSRSSMS